MKHAEGVSFRSRLAGLFVFLRGVFLCCRESVPPVLNAAESGAFARCYRGPRKCAGDDAVRAVLLERPYRFIYRSALRVLFFFRFLDDGFLSFIFVSFFSTTTNRRSGGKKKKEREAA